MAIISQANVLTATDRMARVRSNLVSQLGLAANLSSPVVGTVQKTLDDLLNLIVNDVDDYEQQNDLNQPFFNARAAGDIESVQATILRAAVQALSDHCNQRGGAVDSSIIDLSTYFTYLNTTKFTALVVPEFATLWNDIFNSAIGAGNTMSPGLHPDLDSTVSANGMGSNTFADSYSDGDAVNTTLYSEVVPIIEITTSFSGGTAAPVFSIVGTDDTGVGTTTWDVTPGDTNPTSAITPTITPAVTAEARQTVALSATTGIVAGSVLTINSGSTDQEVIVVESVGGGNITAVFKKAHSAGANITGKTCYATTPSVASRRLRDATDLNITISSHSAGAARIIGIQDRVAI